MRAGTLARQLGESGIRAVLVSGGMPVPVLDVDAGNFEQLPPVRAQDESFNALVDEVGNPITDAWKAHRREQLLTIFERLSPDIVLTELYPFGRRQMRFELEPLLERARCSKRRAKPPLIVSSVRDILVPSSKQGRAEQIIACIRRYYDLVLVHGDENVIPFGLSFPGAAEIADLVYSTGYVVRTVPVKRGPDAPGYDEVIVSAGGGAVGGQLLEAAIDARGMCRLGDKTWRVLVGYNYPEEAFRLWQTRAPSGVIVERARQDFAQLLANCALSISQGGYNTVMEILAAGARAVCVPFADGRESEQMLRCRELSRRGLLQMVEPDALSPEHIAMAVDRAVNLPPISPRSIDTEGAAKSARILLEALQSAA
jgi:predicted glycosyltransferase